MAATIRYSVFGPITKMSTLSVHQFAEKVALVGDVASPIGRAVSMQLALQGAFVVGLFQPADGVGNGLLDELVELGTLAHAVEADPSSEAGSTLAADEVNRLFGRLDLLVNCLKFVPESSFESITESDVLDTLLKNLGSVHFLTRAVFGLMKDRPKPKIVNIVSAAFDSTNPIFAASQAGVISMTRSMTKQFPTNFRINCVEIQSESTDLPVDEHILYRRNQITAPDDIARAVMFLLSSESIGMNGQVLKLG